MFKQRYLNIFLGVLFFILPSTPVFAQGLNDIAWNLTDSTEGLPGLFTAVFYLLGLLFASTGLLKVKEHVENPNQTPLRVPLIRLFAGGALFASPIIYEAMQDAIDAGAITTFGQSQADTDPLMQPIVNTASALAPLGDNVNSIFENVLDSTYLIPGLVTGIGYLLGLLMGGLGILKVKAYVEDPDRNPLKESIIRFVAGGALFALPAIFTAMYTTIENGGMGTLGWFFNDLNDGNFVHSTESGADECLGWMGGTVGDILCNSWMQTAGIAPFLTGLAYMLGIIFGVWGVIKVKDHVLNPMQIHLSEGLMRLLAGGAFFALPFVVSAINTTLMSGGLYGFFSGTDTNTGFVTTGCGAGTHSLDEAMVCLMQDLLGPGQLVLNFFGFVAGMIFIMIGISRLIKSAQEGPKGPGGSGTVATFVTGGLLISASTFVRALSGTMFDNGGVTETAANLAYTTGMTAAETDAIYNVISAVIQFMIIVGLISFVRGLFIMRDVSEGKQQASVMAGMTHIIGGALAVNLGPLINAVETSLNITGWGVTFS
ncbi:MAG: hypothetical protein KDI13_10335 [Alphaproteobacteria bacterium]|nr:hypothetical protein [Alphaproteobacteria bacterium]